MKKSRGRKSTKNRFFNDKKTLAITIVAFLVFAFALNFVNIGITGEATAVDSVIGDLFTNWESGQLDANIAKYIFFFLISAVITGILYYTLISNMGFALIISLPIGFLSTAYLAPEEIFAVLTTYSALGLTISAVIPFVIVVLASAFLVSGEKMKQLTVARTLVQIIIWITFVLFLGYKLIVGYATLERATGVIIILWAIFGISCGILLFNKAFRKYLRTLGEEMREARAKARKVAVEAAQDVAKAGEDLVSRE